MSHTQMLIVLGVLILIVPFIGIPSAWFVFIFPVLGLCVGALGISLRTRKTAPVVSYEQEPPIA